jgi:Predicted transcriptional regulator
MDEITQKELEGLKAELELAQKMAGGKDDLAEALKVSVRTIDLWLAGGGITLKNRRKLREFIASNGVDGATFAYGDVTLPAFTCEGRASQSSSDTIKEDPGFIDVALREATASMGGGSTETGKMIRQFLKFRRDWIMTQTTTPLKLSCIKCFGDSMSPTVTDNSVVLIDEGRPTFVSNKVFYIRHEGQMFLKRLTGKPGDIYIVSDNDPDNPIHIEDGDDFEIIARAVWMGRLIE